MTEEIVRIPIEGVLDLHTFDPKDVGELLTEYLEQCREKGIMEVKIIHGKGTGALKAAVLSRLKRIPFVESAGDAGYADGGWGATIVRLK